MSTEEPPFSSAKSLLDKPLHQLTEDDISQLTREDCRRYLKQKGMRRPSWNKSQAIQQVIMLKTLLEPTPDSDTGSRKLYITPRQQQTPATRVQKGTSADTEISVSAEESVPGQCAEADKSDLPGATPAHLVAADNDSVPPGITGVTDEAKGQMTIFYSGKVNVYDDVPAEKARVLLQLAASPLCFPQEDPSDGNLTMGPLPCHMQAPTAKLSQESAAMLLPTVQTVRMNDNSRQQREENNVGREDNSAAEGSASRKASVQRYLEKRKDRFRSKRRPGALSCASLDVNFSHQTGNQNLSEQSSRSDTCSPPPVRPPNTPNRFC